MINLKPLSVLCISLFLMIPGAKAAEPSSSNFDAGRDAALQVCANMDMPSHREDCRKIVGPARSFTVSAVQFCGRFDFTPYINDCLEAIRDRHYSDSEVQLCDRENSDRRKIECMGSLGNTPSPQLPPGLSSQIRSAIRAIDAGYPYEARQILMDLLNRP